MKTLILPALLAICVADPAIADSSCSKDEKTMYEIVKNGYQQGFAETIVEVGEAQLDYLRAQLECKEISKANFCKEAIELARTTLSAAINQMASGVKSSVTVIHYQREYRETKALCK